MINMNGKRYKLRIESKEQDVWEREKGIDELMRIYGEITTASGLFEWDIINGLINRL